MPVRPVPRDGEKNPPHSGTSTRVLVAGSITHNCPLSVRANSVPAKRPACRFNGGEARPSKPAAPMACSCGAKFWSVVAAALIGAMSSGSVLLPGVISMNRPSRVTPRIFVPTSSTNCMPVTTIPASVPRKPSVVLSSYF